MLKPTVSCLHCGWIHFEVTLAHALNEVNSYNDYVDRMAATGVQLRKAHLDTYKKCNRCGGSYENFDFIDDDNIPLGITIGPILARSEKP